MDLFDIVSQGSSPRSIKIEDSESGDYDYDTLLSDPAPGDESGSFVMDANNANDEAGALNPNMNEPRDIGMGGEDDETFEDYHQDHNASPPNDVAGRYHVEIHVRQRHAPDTADNDSTHSSSTRSTPNQGTRVASDVGSLEDTAGFSRVVQNMIRNTLVSAKLQIERELNAHSAATKTANEQAIDEHYVKYSNAKHRAIRVDNENYKRQQLAETKAVIDQAVQNQEAELAERLERNNETLQAEYDAKQRALEETYVRKEANVKAKYGKIKDQINTEFEDNHRAYEEDVRDLKKSFVQKKEQLQKEFSEEKAKYKAALDIDMAEEKKIQMAELDDYIEREKRRRMAEVDSEISGERKARYAALGAEVAQTSAIRLAELDGPVASVVAPPNTVDVNPGISNQALVSDVVSGTLSQTNPVSLMAC